MKEFFYGHYATRVYLPVSAFSRRWRNLSRRLRGKPDPFFQNGRLPAISWKECTTRRSVEIREHRKSNGNVRLSELAILSALAADCTDGSNLFEIGTFDGRTTLNLVLNAPPRCTIYTLDLPPDLETKFPLAAGERHMIDKPKPGARYEAYRETHPGAVGRITQLLGDSAAFDYSPYRSSCSLVFVDGSHGYDYVVSDTRAAIDMASHGGAVVWHDYGIWNDVTQALDELEQREGYGLRNIRGTSLVYWRKT
jgi:hypothetical protein